MKKAINKIALISILFIGLISCENNGYEDFTQVNSPSVALDGEWYVQTLYNGKVVVDYKLIYTYDTAANGAEMWVDDKGNIWNFKCKSPVNVDALTFAGNNLASSVVDDDPKTPNVIETYDINVNITEGKVIKNGATSTGGQTVDAIQFKAEFSDDPGSIYEIKGYKRTGFEEDEH